MPSRMTLMFLLLLTLKPMAIVICHGMSADGNNYERDFLTKYPVYYQQDVQHKSKLDHSVQDAIFKKATSTDDKFQNEPSSNPGKSSSLKLHLSLHNLNDNTNLKTRKRRRKRWSRFDISDPPQNIITQSPKQRGAKGLGDEKRNIKISINAPLSDYAHDSENDIRTKQLLRKLVEEYVKNQITEQPNKEEIVNSPNSDEDDNLVGENVTHSIMQKPKHRNKPELQSATDCDEWDKSIRTCFFDRNIGDTITFVLTFNNLGLDEQIKIQWQQEFNVRNSNSTILLEIHPDNTMWNVVIGSNNHEFRISPITETDFDRNGFTAIAIIHHPGSKNDPVITKITFRIRQMATDMGFVYPGEHIIINVKSFMTLPIECCSFEWYLDRSKSQRFLPSNMKVSDTGITVEISELRMEQEGILACDVYSNRNVFLTKKRFLIKEFKRDTLMQISTNRRNERATRLLKRTILKRVIRQAEETPDNNENGEGFNVDNIETTPPILQENQAYEITTNIFNALNPNPFTEKLSQEKNLQTEQNILASVPINWNSAMPANQFLAANQNTAFGESSKAGLRPESSSNSIEEFVIETGKLREEEKIEARISKLMADCVSNRQCSGDAICYQENVQSRRFCKCLIGYRGNGLFCWEEAVGKRHLPSVYFSKNEGNNVAAKGFQLLTQHY